MVNHTLRAPIATLLDFIQLSVEEFGGFDENALVAQPWRGRNRVRHIRGNIRESI